MSPVTGEANMEEHKYVSGVRIHSGETGPRCVVCSEPEDNWRHVPSVVFGDKPAHEFDDGYMGACRSCGGSNGDAQHGPTPTKDPR